MKKLLLATAVSALMSSGAYAAEVKLGVILGFTGPIESLTPDMADGAEYRGGRLLRRDNRDPAKCGLGEWHGDGVSIRHVACPVHS